MEFESHDTDTLAFYVRLLTQMKLIEDYPFTKMVIEEGVTKDEYQELMKLLTSLHNQYEEQKEAGMLDFTQLLIHFAGMLPIKLHPDLVMNTLIKEGINKELMKEFLNIRRKHVD